MKQNIFLSIAIIIFIAANFVTADTREVDPLTPLDQYISVGEWNTPGDVEGWTADNQITNLTVAGGYLTGTINGIGNDPWIHKALAAGSFINVKAGSIFEIRIKYSPDANLTNAGAYFYLNAGGWNPKPYALYEEMQIDGQFHVYRLTVSANVGDTMLGNCRLDITQGASFPGVDFEIDYVRIKTPQMVDPSYRAGLSFANMNSLADWNSSSDTNWALANIDGEEIAGGYLTATNHGDGMIYKYVNAGGLPAIDLDSADNKIIQVRMRNTGADSGKQLYFGTSATPGISGARSGTFSANTIPVDGNFHIYQFDMTDHAEWASTLRDIRFDPASLDPAYIEVDYIHVGKIIPEPATFGFLALLGLAFLRRK